MKRVLVMTSRVPWKLEKGDKLRIYQQLKALRGKAEVCLCCLSERPVDAATQAALSAVCDRLEVFHIGRLGRMLQLAWGLFSDRPFQVHYFYRRRVRSRVYRIAAEFQPDHIYCQLIRAAEYVKHIHSCPKTLDYMDALNKGMERRMERATGVRRHLFAWEAQRLKAYENLIYDYFEHHTIISKEDRDHILHANRDRIAVVPNGVDTDFFQPSKSVAQWDVLFLGNMQYAPNIDGAEFLVQVVLPIVRRSMPNVRVLIAGAQPHRRVRALAGNGVKVSGWLEDVREAYGTSRVFVAPMRIGTGLQNKMLEAMSMELPCISTPLAFNPLKDGAGEVVVRGETAEALAQAIVLDLQSEESRLARGRKGRAFVRKHYSWEACSRPLIERLIE